MTYPLNITEQDRDTFALVGDRYCWSAACLRLLDEGVNDVSEPDAWDLREAFEADTEGNHSPFPMLDGSSELAEKLFSFWEGII